jgi:hypothetical protein
LSTLVKDNQLAAANNYGTLGSILRPAVIRVGDVSRSPGERYAVTTMLTTAGGHVKVSSVFLVFVGLLALVVLAIAVGVHVFLAAVGHYAPWEQIWAG